MADALVRSEIFGGAESESSSTIYRYCILLARRAVAAPILCAIPSCPFIEKKTLSMSAIRHFSSTARESMPDTPAQSDSRKWRGTSADRAPVRFVDFTAYLSCRRPQVADICARSPVQTLPSRWPPTSCLADLAAGSVPTSFQLPVHTPGPFHRWASPPLHQVIFQCLSVVPRTSSSPGRHIATASSMP